MPVYKGTKFLLRASKQAGQPEVVQEDLKRATMNLEHFETTSKYRMCKSFSFLCNIQLSLLFLLYFWPNLQRKNVETLNCIIA